MTLLWVHGANSRSNFPLIQYKLSTQISNLTSSSWAAYINSSPFYNSRNLKGVTDAFISSCLDICNALYVGVGLASLSRLQSVHSLVLQQMLFIPCESLSWRRLWCVFTIGQNRNLNANNTGPNTRWINYFTAAKHQRVTSVAVWISRWC